MNRTEINKITSAMGKVIETKDLEYAIEFHLSNNIKWHNERTVTLHPEYEFAFFKKQQHLVLSKSDYNKELYSSCGNMSRM